MREVIQNSSRDSLSIEHDSKACLSLDLKNYSETQEVCHLNVGWYERRVSEFSQLWVVIRPRWWLRVIVHHNVGRQYKVLVSLRLLSFVDGNRIVRTQAKLSKVLLWDFTYVHVFMKSFTTNCKWRSNTSGWNGWRRTRLRRDWWFVGASFYGRRITVRVD